MTDPAPVGGPRRALLAEETDLALARALQRLGEAKAGVLVGEALDEWTEPRDRPSHKVLLRRAAGLARRGIFQCEKVGRNVIYSLNEAEYDFAFLGGWRLPASTVWGHVQELRERVLRPWREQLPSFASFRILVAVGGRAVPYRPQADRLPVERDPLFADISNHLATSDDPLPVWRQFKEAAGVWSAFLGQFSDDLRELLASHGWRVTETQEDRSCSPGIATWLLLWATLPPPAPRDAERVEKLWKLRVGTVKRPALVVARMSGEPLFFAAKTVVPGDFTAEAEATWEEAKRWARNEGRPAAGTAVRRLEEAGNLCVQLARMLPRCEKILIPNDVCPILEGHAPRSRQASSIT